jgi:hypothetical protein
MWATIVSFFQAKAMALIGWLAIAGSVLLVLFKAKEAGREAERVDNLTQTLKVKNAQQKAAASSPRTRDELIDELRRGDF